MSVNDLRSLYRFNHKTLNRIFYLLIDFYSGTNRIRTKDKMILCFFFALTYFKLSIKQPVFNFTRIIIALIKFIIINHYRHVFSSQKVSGFTGKNIS